MCPCGVVVCVPDDGGNVEGRSGVAGAAAREVLMVDMLWVACPMRVQGVELMLMHTVQSGPLGSAAIANAR